MSTGTIDSVQPRRPKGAPVGGQFAEKQNTPPGGSLVDSVSGSFLFPPNNLSTADALVKFFTTQPISDRVLSNARYAYRAWREQKIRDHVSVKLAAWEQSREANRIARKQGDEGLDHAAEPLLHGWRAEAEAMYSVEQLPASHTRPVLVARQIVVYRGILEDDAEEQKALEHEIVVSGDTYNVSALVAEYSAHEWAPRALTESDLPAVDSMSLVARILDEQAGVKGRRYPGSL